MSIIFNCASCGKPIECKFLKPGAIAHCKNCGTYNVIPREGEQARNADESETPATKFKIPAADESETPVVEFNKPKMEYASVLTRFGSLVIDGLLVLPFYIPVIIIFSIAGDDPFADNLAGTVNIVLYVLTIISAIIFTIWNTIVRMGKTGQSLGRTFLHIAVLDEYGKPIGIGRAIIREIFGRWISGMVCYIGYLNAFWDNRKQMWHDKMAKCFVYYVEEDFLKKKKINSEDQTIV